MFIQVTSKTEIAALAQAGLLWDSVLGMASQEWDGPFLTQLDDDDTVEDLLWRANNCPDWRFFVLLED